MWFSVDGVAQAKMVISKAHQLTAISTSVYRRSKHRRVTKNMISAPVSPSFDGVPDIIPFWHAPLLEYLSRKLLEKHLHITLIVSQHASDTHLISASSLDPRPRTVLAKLVPKATQRFPAGKQWLDALSQDPLDARPHSSYLRRRSIIQNEILFSSEGLTLLSIDHVYTFKHHLATLSSPGTRARLEAPEDSLVRSVHHLHRITAAYGGRPLTKAYILRAYDHLHVDEELLRRVCAAYEDKYGRAGILLAGKDSGSPRPEEAAKTFRRHSGPPKTPNSASEVTPITQNEWELLIMLQC